eukprot:TRINITY_DN8365_c3_g1_i1.p1 TRINITY_DN8365_c3_g1~~TRINITY_DN8365_c3_g1_i1.p1  ORF type:complete len:316 (+),score=36.36 TRINITY_DN8365_c3_g1_i1:100-948(+)
MAIFSRLALALVATVPLSEGFYTFGSSKKEPPTEVQVQIQSGPTECSESETIRTNKHAKIMYAAKIHESSIAGEADVPVYDTHMLHEGFDIHVGTKQYIEGWDIGLVGLCKGAKAHILMPPHVAHGDEGDGALTPGNATLHFDVNIMDVSDTPFPVYDFFGELDTDKDDKISFAEAEAYFTKPIAQFGDAPQFMPDGWFDEHDRNRDGFIVRREFQGPGGTFDPYDPEWHDSVFAEALENTVMVDDDGNPVKKTKEKVFDAHGNLLEEKIAFHPNEPDDDEL